ncbi:MAG: O-methyltransferase [Halodesulfurarchaeum sp.]
MSGFLSESAERLLALGNPDPDPVLEEMTTYGREQGFPTVGPAVGQFLSVAAAMVGAKRVFEFGSGFGYSAAWFAQALGPDSELVLTDYREENLDRARDFFDELEYEGRVRYEVGDALAGFDETDGPFDVILIDLDKHAYPSAWERSMGRTAPGGLIIADNMMGGPVTPAGVVEALEGDGAPDEATQGVAAYIERMRSTPEYRSALVPLGQGIAVSLRTEREA